MNSLVERAEIFARKAHEGQRRKHSLMSYIVHPRAVYFIIYNMRPEDYELQASAWLHDVVEDTSTTLDDLREQFGDRVAQLVNEVSHPPTEHKLNRAGRWQVYLQHYKNASDDGKFLKLIDRTCNMTDYLVDFPLLEKSDRNFLSKVYIPETHELLKVVSHTSAFAATACYALCNDLVEKIEVINDK